MIDAPESSPEARAGEVDPPAPVVLHVRAGDRLRVWRADGRDLGVVVVAATDPAADLRALVAPAVDHRSSVVPGNPLRVALPDGRVLDVPA